MAKRHQVPKKDEDLQARLGVVIRTCRRHLGITQEELAWRSGMHRTYIADIERGARNVTLRSVSNLAKALQVTVGNLFSYATAPDGVNAAMNGPTISQPLGEILLIEDNSDDAELVGSVLKQARIANPLKVSRDGAEALEYLSAASRHAQPQLVLLDLSLPTLSGFECLRRLKGNPSTRDLNVVALTTSDRDVVECGRLGVAHCIAKPFAFENLVRIAPTLNLQLVLTPAPAVNVAAG